MSDTFPKRSRSSEFHSHPLIVRQWMVTAPFLSLSVRYLFLEGNRTWGFSDLQVGLRQDKDRILSLGSIIMLSVSDPLIQRSSTVLPPEFGISFFKYLMDITDTRRTAFHYGFISGIWLEHSKNLDDVSSPVFKLYKYLLRSSCRSGDEQSAAAKDEILKEFEAACAKSLIHGRGEGYYLVAENNVHVQVVGEMVGSLVESKQVEAGLEQAGNHHQGDFDFSGGVCGQAQLHGQAILESSLMP
ncbi:hypothetical protein R1sor_004703 [Riccia sorocarpa]|uniref:Uncharacterized protein n=1 Tax=Riccia sorocarpa TaxID=122646 RepID=A0ABD3HHQ0_9MARC